MLHYNFFYNLVDWCLHIVDILKHSSFFLLFRFWNHFQIELPLIRANWEQFLQQQEEEQEAVQKPETPQQEQKFWSFCVVLWEKVFLCFCFLGISMIVIEWINCSGPNDCSVSKWKSDKIGSKHDGVAKSKMLIKTFSCASKCGISIIWLFYINQALTCVCF